LNTTLTPHSIIHGDACFAYFNKIWGIPRGGGVAAYGARAAVGDAGNLVSSTAHRSLKSTCRRFNRA
jgi:hypothetical protein